MREKAQKQKSSWAKGGPCLYPQRVATYYAHFKLVGKQIRRSLEAGDPAFASCRLRADILSRPEFPNIRLRMARNWLAFNSSSPHWFDSCKCQLSRGDLSYDVIAKSKNRKSAAFADHFSVRQAAGALALLLLGLPFSATAGDEEQENRLLFSPPPGNRDGCRTSGDEEGGLPLALQPAARFQKTFLKILAGEKPAGWRGEMESFCAQPADTPLAAGLCEVARVWIARAQMQEIDALLHDYYRRSIRFPAKLGDLGPLPPALQKDPWGGPWSYSPLSPQGFSKLAAQRYQLGPAKFPKLAKLSEAIRKRLPPPRAWRISSSEVSGTTALEFRGAQSTAVIQPGGEIEGCSLLFIGDKWALMAGMDQLFTVVF